MRRGTNLPAIGGFNQAVVLDLVRRSHEGLSRVELADASGLSSQTVTNVARRLLADGLIRETGTRIAGPGKPRTMLALQRSGGYAVGVHLDPTFITYVLADLGGGVVAHARSRTPATVRPDDVIEIMAASIETLIGSAGIARERLLGIGIAAPGPIDRAAGVVDDPPLLPGWQHVPLRDALGERLRLPVALEKDTTASAIAEQWTTDDATPTDAAFFYYGTGLGLGMVLDSATVRGATANAGDIGHLRVADDGPLCSCGRRGCLGENTSPARLVEAAISAGVLADVGAPLDSLAVDEAYTRMTELALQGDERARGILLGAARDVASGLVTLANLLDVERVVCGGPFWERLASVGIEELRARVSADPSLVAPHPVSVESTRLGSDVAAIGAACLVLDAVYSPHPAALLIAAR